MLSDKNWVPPLLKTSNFANPPGPLLHRDLTISSLNYTDECMKDIDEIIKYLKKNEIDPKIALNVLKREFAPVNSGHKKTAWKMIKFQLYIWERLIDYNNNKERKRIEVVERLVYSIKYKKAYDMFPNPPFNAPKEIKNLAQLIAEPRQDKYFISKNFSEPGRPTKKLPQELLNKLR